jgi:hypothetical protein
MFTPTDGLPISGGKNTGHDPVVSTSSDHPDLTTPATANLLLTG